MFAHELGQNGVCGLTGRLYQPEHHVRPKSIQVSSIQVHTRYISMYLDTTMDMVGIPVDW